ncbi:MAG TPA: ABC transporter substrate-binding protein [Candidatus Wallbacteria bacterium]|nr:ABC transporter substrate-binding protein [Candidatus Wallbacteria bacterium]
MLKFKTGYSNFILVMSFFIAMFFFSQAPAAAGPSKIIAMDPMVSQWLLALKCVEGAKDILIGEVGKSNYMSEIFPELKDNIMRKKTDNVESIMLLNPRIIFLKTGTEHNLSDLKKSGVEIVSFDFEKLDDIFKGVAAMGRSLKMEKRAEELNEYFKKAMETTGKDIGKNANNGPKPRVYFANSNVYSSVGKGMYQNFLIETAGGASVTANAPGSKIQISLEELIKWDPEIIITASYCSETPDMIMQNDKLKDLAAVKNKKIFVMPRYITSWDMPVPESLLGIIWLSNKLHPEIKLDLNRKIKDFYKIFYNTKVDDSKIEKMINR